MENRKNDLMIAACIGVGSFVLGFVTAKLVGCRKKENDTCICCCDGCDENCESCEFADECRSDYDCID